MRLYIKKDTTVNKAMFLIFDELCNEKYVVEGNKDKLILKDMENNTLMKITTLSLFNLKVYSFTTTNSNMKLLVNKFKKPAKATFYGSGWFIRGDILTKSFDIIDADNSLVASHIKRFSPCGDGYELNIIKENKELFAIGVALCVNLQQMVDIMQIQPV